MHPNAARLAQAMMAFSSGSHDQLTDFFADDLEWFYAGKSRFAGRYQGVGEVMKFFQSIQEAANVKVTPISLLASDRHAVAFVTVSMERDGRTIEVTEANALQFNADGKCNRFFQLASDQDALDAFLT